jgi:hypothetical protein
MKKTVPQNKIPPLIATNPSKTTPKICRTCHLIVWFVLFLGGECHFIIAYVEAIRCPSWYVQGGNGMSFGPIEKTTDWYKARGKSERTTKKVEKALQYGT